MLAPLPAHSLRTTHANTGKYWLLKRSVVACSAPLELDALQEFLLTLPSVLAAPPAALEARLKDPADLVAAVLSGLATSEVAAVWPLLQTDSAKAHARWPELCVRVIEAAVRRRSAGVDVGEWHAAVAAHVQERSCIAPLAFRKLTIDTQLQLLEDVKLTEAEVADVRAQCAAGGEECDAALSAALEAKCRRDAAARILQARLPAYLARLRERRQRAAALRVARAWLARSCAVRACAVQGDAVLALLARAITLAERAGAWRVMLGALAQLWDAMRVHLLNAEALAAPGHAEWQRRPGDDDSAPLWQLAPVPPSASRTLRTVLRAVVHFAELLRSGAARLGTDLAGGGPAATLAELLPGAAWRDGAASSASPPESGAQAQRWLAHTRAGDFAWLNQLFLAGFAVFAAQDRHATLVGIGSTWARVTCGAFDGSVMPHLIAHAAQAGAEAAPFVAALAAAQQTRSEAANALDAVRASAQQALGDGLPLAAPPSVGRCRKTTEGASDSAPAVNSDARSAEAQRAAAVCNVQVCVPLRALCIVHDAVRVVTHCSRGEPACKPAPAPLAPHPFAVATLL